jgi:LPS sulfotransferase NodH
MIRSASARETQAAHRTFWAEAGEYPCEVLAYEALALHPRAVVAALYARLGLGRPRRHETVRDDNARHYPMGG